VAVIRFARHSCAGRNPVAVRLIVAVRLLGLAYGECFVPLPRPDLLSLAAQEKVGKEKGTLHGALR